MTHTEKGYADAKSGAIDSGLYGDAGVQGREYRDGMREARRDAVDGVIAANEGLPPPLPSDHEEPAVFDNLYQQEPIPPAAPSVIAPVYDKKKTRKAKPVDADQGTFL